MSTIKQWWSGHGTKILGVLTALVAGLAMIPEFSAYPAPLLVLKCINVGLGLVTINRGFMNSAAISAQKDQ